MGKLKSPQTDLDLRIANGAVVALNELKQEFDRLRLQAIEERS